MGKKVDKDTAKFLQSKKRTRVLAFVVYPDSAPEDWIEQLQDLHIEAFAILHDQDKNPDGTTKKPHYHVMLMNASPKSPEQWIEIRDKLGGVGLEVIASTRGYARYLLHLDNPEKHRYTTDELMIFAGADYQKMINTARDDDEAQAELRRIVRENEIEWIDRLWDYLEAEGLNELLSFMNRNSYSITAYVKSRAQRRREEQAQKERNW